MDALAISRVSANGPLQLTVGGALTGTLAQCTASTVDINATTVDLMTVFAAASANLTATTGNLQVVAASAGGRLSLQGQTGIVAGSLVTSGLGGITASTATGDLLATQVVSADLVTLTASTGSVLIDTVQGQNDVTLTAGQSIAGRSTARYDSVQSVTAQVNLQAQGGDITGNHPVNCRQCFADSQHRQPHGKHHQRPNQRRPACWRRHRRGRRDCCYRQCQPAGARRHPGQPPQRRGGRCHG
jgi:hypothetical protein